MSFMAQFKMGPDFGFLSSPCIHVLIWQFVFLNCGMFTVTIKTNYKRHPPLKKRHLENRIWIWTSSSVWWLPVITFAGNRQHGRLHEVNIRTSYKHTRWRRLYIRTRIRSDGSIRLTSLTRSLYGTHTEYEGQQDRRHWGCQAVCSVTG